MRTGGTDVRGASDPGGDRSDRGAQLRRAVVASAIGTAVEWYDFFLYGLAAALVFPKTFFPQSDPYVGTLLSFSTYFVGFASRPIGAALFGHVGDRVGRKASLIATLVLMGVATMSIGLVPGYDSIGIGGAVLLTLARALQGVAVGGEWGGSVLIAAEWAKRGNRGFAASWPQWGAPAGLLLANGALFLATRASGDAFNDWGWRLPFLASALLVAVGFWIRIGIEEPPAFAKMRAEGRSLRAPVAHVLRHHWREVVLTTLVRTGQQAPFYIFSVFVLSYATGTLGLARDRVLGLVLVAAVISMVTIPLAGHLSDRFGRRRVVAVGCVLMLVWPFLYFEMLAGAAIAVAIFVSGPIHDLQYGPQAALIAESFPAHVRYSGSSLGYQLASVTAGGPAPIVATWLMHEYQSARAVALYMAACAAVSLIALALLRPGHADGD
jgi:metabolite-proton symporter